MSVKPLFLSFHVLDCLSLIQECAITSDLAVYHSHSLDLISSGLEILPLGNKFSLVLISLLTSSERQHIVWTHKRNGEYDRMVNLVCKEAYLW